jgi:hypothetical protein
MADSFNEITRLYQSIASKDTKTEGYFATVDFQKSKEANNIAYKKIEPLCKSLIEVLQCKNSGDDLELSGLQSKICFYRRILKKQPKEKLPSDTATEIDEIIKNSFLLGLTSHLYLLDNPSRNGFENADAAAIMKILAPYLMASSGKMRKYNKKFNTIPILIFENYFDTHIAPVLNGKLDLGLLQCASARNYFTNLFFAGARFGEMLDKDAEKNNA